VIVEPVAGNMNLILPQPKASMQALRDLVQSQHGAVLIFDEVMTGFRVVRWGARSRMLWHHAGPDDARQGDRWRHAGRRLRWAAASHHGPDGTARSGLSGGTLSGNPVAVAAGLATLKLVRAAGFYEALAERSRQLSEGLLAAAGKHGVPFSAQSMGGMFGLYFRASCPQTYAEAMACDSEAFKRFFHGMLDAGHYFAPSAFEAGFVSAAHSEADVAATVAAAEGVFKAW
jgi:glutamate-1-semialdehyde 2,1-aminomutase